MPPSRSAALAILGLATVTAAGLALQQYRRAEALAAQLAAREATALAHRPVAQPAPAASTAPAVDDMAGTDDEPAPPLEAAAPPAEEAEPRRDRRGENRPDPGAIMEQLMQDPAFAEAMRTQQRARLDNRYAALFARLNLPPAQLDQLKDLLSEKMNAPRDVLSAARAEGLGRGNREEIRALIDATQQEIDAEIRQTIGDQAYSALQSFEQTESERRLVSSLADRLSYSGTPLNSAQSEALVTILADASAGQGSPGPRTRAAAMMDFMPGGGGGGGGTAITDEIIVRATGVLAPDQVNALRELQAEQAAAATVRDAMRESFRGGAGNRRTAPAAPTPGG